jgi:pyruvate dehydrogenase E2 component (dihydrolipoamide acetyltransferase)
MQLAGDTPPATTAKGAVRIEEPSRAERQIGRRAAESRATVPAFELATVVDMSATVTARREFRAAAGGSAATGGTAAAGRSAATGGSGVPSLTAMVVRACALALRAYPRANASYRDGHFELYDRVNVGVAMMSGDSFAVPTILDADTKTALEIAGELRSLAARVRAGTITSPELAGATFTMSNLGIMGVSNFNPPVLPPQAAILAVGAMRAVPIVRGEDIVAGHEMNLTLTCDHRILYGTGAAEFLTRIRRLLEQPQELLS